MSSDDTGPLKTVTGWLLAVGILVAKTVEWVVLWPYRVARLYWTVAAKRWREGAEEESAPDD